MLQLAVEPVVGRGTAEELSVDEAALLGTLGEILHEVLGGAPIGAGGLEGNG